MHDPQDHAPLSPRPPGRTVLIAGAEDGDAIGAALRGKGFDVACIALSDLPACILAEAPAVVIVDIDHPDAAAALEGIHEHPSGAATTVLLLGDPVRSAELSPQHFTQIFERPVDLAELSAHLASVVEPRPGSRGSPFPSPSYPPPASPHRYPRHPSGRPAQRDSDAPLDVSDFPPDLEPVDVGSLLPPASGDDGNPRLSSARISPELEQLLAAAEARVTGSAHPSSIPSVDDEADLILSADILGVLEEPLDPEDDGPRTGSASGASTPTHGHPAPHHGYLDMVGPSSLPVSLGASSGAGAWAAGSPFGGALLHPPPPPAPVSRRDPAEFHAPHPAATGFLTGDVGPALTPRAGVELPRGMRHPPQGEAVDTPRRTTETSYEEERWAAGTRDEADARRAEIQEAQHARQGDGWDPSLTSTSAEQADPPPSLWTASQREPPSGATFPGARTDFGHGPTFSGPRTDPGKGTFTGPRTEAGKSTTFTGPRTEGAGVPPFSGPRPPTIAPLVSPPREVQVRNLSEAVLDPRRQDLDLSPGSVEPRSRQATISDFPIDDGLITPDEHPYVRPPTEPPGVVHAERSGSNHSPSDPSHGAPLPAPERHQRFQDDAHAPLYPHGHAPAHPHAQEHAPAHPQVHAHAQAYALPHPQGQHQHAPSYPQAPPRQHAVDLPTGSMLQPSPQGHASHLPVPTGAHSLPAPASLPLPPALQAQALPLSASPATQAAPQQHLAPEDAASAYSPPAVTVLGPGDAPRALARAVASRASGSMALTTDAGTRRLVLHEGDIVTAASDAPDETLLAFLAARGDLDRDLAVRLSGRLPASGRHAGAALIAHGYLGQDDLWPVLRAHAEWLIGHLVLIDGGTCEVEEEAPGRLKAEPNVFGGATGAEVFVETIRRVVPADIALRRLGGGAARLDEGARRNLLGECALRPEEEDLFRVARGRAVSELIDATEPETATLLYALVCLEVLDVLIPQSVSEAPRAPEHDPLDEEAIRQRVRARLQLVEDGDYFSLLGIARDATSYEIKRAYLALRRAFEPSRLLTAGTADLLDDVQLIVDILDEAYDILRDTHRRERYRRAIEAPPP
ncbi:hypothetical protein [Chondromyces apiculatus]|uniref:J domain-containing protein n=1 Tax=Chondromyces apiculatus DSM 436 TaxID=1192034 RepID=A0A017SYR4_9BACT|nr:hypothetical protein [Chondromyces apiculatus]EYF01446.1 Hypothetical protein CAP_8279 [Chondromyces apiculatus DSM 436]